MTQVTPSSSVGPDAPQLSQKPAGLPQFCDKTSTAPLGIPTARKTELL